MRGLIKQQIEQVRNGMVETVEDCLAEEAPLEIRVNYLSKSERKTQALSITMRTSGADADLAIGFLFTEGIIRSFDDIKTVKQSDSESQWIEIVFQDNFVFKDEQLDRNFYTTSSCGVCGKSSIEAIKTVSAFELHKDSPTFDPSVLPTLLKAILNEQGLFSKTGGIHAAFLFSSDGQFIDKREDVGRHNASKKQQWREFLLSYPLALLRIWR